MILKKISFSLLFIYLGSLFLTGQTVAVPPSDWTDGSGGTISNLAELRWLSETTAAWDEDWVLTSDIDAAETRFWNISGEDTLGFSPIGDRSNGNRQQVEFVGSFDGGDHKIYNLTINRPLEDYVGLFGYVDNHDSKISHLGLIDVSVSGSSQTGGLIGWSKAYDISYCYVNGTIKSDSWKVGGLIGELWDGELRKCFSDCDITGNSRVGGLVGDVFESFVDDCFSYSNVEGNSRVGGFAGNHGKSSDIRNCYAIGPVSMSVISGPFVGLVESDAVIINSFYDYQKSGINGNGLGDSLSSLEFSDKSNFTTWDFTDTWEITRLNEFDTIFRPYLRFYSKDYRLSVIKNLEEAGTITGENYYNQNDVVTLIAKPNPGYAFRAWIFAGDTISKEEQYSFTYTTDSSQEYEALFYTNFVFDGGNGTLAAPYQISTLEQLNYLNFNSELTNMNYILVADINAAQTYNWTNVNGDTVGFDPIKIFTGSIDGRGHVIDSLYIHRPTEWNIGLISYAYGISIKNLGLTNVNIKGKGQTGALLGILNYNNESSEFIQCFSTGKIQSEEIYAGGLIGFSWGSNSFMENCFTKADISGYERIGGLSGFYPDDIFNSYAACTLHGTERVAAVTSHIDQVTSIVTGCFFDSTLAEGLEAFNAAPPGFYAKGLLTDDFASEASFPGWDFNDTWEIGTISSIDSVPRPYFKWLFHEFNMQFSSDGNGHIEGNTLQHIKYGMQSMPVTAIPDSGYTFLEWTNTEGDRLDTCSLEIPNVTKNMHWIAKFEKLPNVIDNSPVSGNVFQCYPNPANDYLSIKAEQSGTIQVLDLQGSCVALKQIEKPEVSIIDVNHLIPGFYIIQFTTEDLSVSKKLVIR